MNLQDHRNQKAGFGLSEVMLGLTLGFQYHVAGLLYIAMVTCALLPTEGLNSSLENNGIIIPGRSILARRSKGSTVFVFPDEDE